MSVNQQMPTQEPSTTLKLVYGYLYTPRFKIHHLHFNYQSGASLLWKVYIHSRESNLDSYTGASIEWQKTQLLGQNTGFRLNRSVAIKMLFVCSIYCL